MTEKHTPGPWRAKDGQILSPEGDHIGVIYRAEAWSSGDVIATEDQANIANATTP
jgi:hypothetical protein